MAKITIAVMAGGKSTRLGSDKAELTWKGKSFLNHICYEAKLTGLDVIVVGRESPVDWKSGDIAFIPDMYPNIGPIGGLITAIEHLGDSAILLLPVDCPLIKSEHINWLIEQYHSDNLGMIVRTDNGIEPLFSIYNQSCKSLIQDSISNGMRSLQKVISVGDFNVVEAPENIEKALFNVNTLEDLEKLNENY